MLVRSGTVDDIPAVLPMVAKICALHESWDRAKYGFIEHPEQRYEKFLMRMAQNERSVFLVARRRWAAYSVYNVNNRGRNTNLPFKRICIYS